MKIVVPIAGQGSRFQALSNENNEYKKPKPLILVKGRPMIVWAIESLPFIDLPTRPAKTKLKVKPNELIFITLQRHEDIYHISTRLKTLFGSEICIIILPQATRGAVETVLAVKKYINTSTDLLITDCDNYFDGTNLYTAITKKTPDTVGIIPVFQPFDTDVKWSYTLFDKNNIALAVGEKDSQLAEKGAYANIGAYYFSKGSLFVQEAEKMLAENKTFGPSGKEEFYIAPIYESLITKGMIVKTAIIPKLWPLGTPKDLEYFIKHFHE